eukprot:gnl/MRDRNA2_/MRDRNA2_97424_c0_seq1.p1 gnl/MRDRNA2_/MRDRNA2_97424_c0~~gnl/MRDRNA2_/MRDRNA2_97424_c0_seq1.p1  ORF type:complete len:319 (+),score=83.50 gnl/MRDRNA2_/MRDRNA2_97424_c0_seq1:105-1061(+)
MNAATAMCLRLVLFMMQKYLSVSSAVQNSLYERVLQGWLRKTDLDHVMLKKGLPACCNRFSPSICSACSGCSAILQLLLTPTLPVIEFSSGMATGRRLAAGEADKKRKFQGMWSKYQILGVKEDADESEIKKAYHRIAKEQHPDKGGDKENFQKVADAYDTLKDKSKRLSYDHELSCQRQKARSEGRREAVFGGATVKESDFTEWRHPGDAESKRSKREEAVNLEEESKRLAKLRAQRMARESQAMASRKKAIERKEQADMMQQMARAAAEAADREKKLQQWRQQQAQTSGSQRMGGINTACFWGNIIFTIISLQALV